VAICSIQRSAVSGEYVFTKGFDPRLYAEQHGLAPDSFANVLVLTKGGLARLIVIDPKSGHVTSLETRWSLREDGTNVSVHKFSHSIAKPPWGSGIRLAAGDGVGYDKVR